MFRSFFPNPRLFFPAAILWIAAAMFLWFTVSDQIGSVISLGDILGIAPTEDDPAPFFSSEKVWLYQYVLMAGYLFCVPWYFTNKTPWFWWSVVGSVTILQVVYFQVQIGAWINDWTGSFFNIVQQALNEPNSVEPVLFYGKLQTLILVLLPNITILVINAFFVAHYLFRWRRAMSAFYMAHWPILRKTEGASQRIQEDTQRFSRIVEGLAVSFVSAIMTLIVFLPLLYELSTNITELPIIGPVDGSLVWIALMSAAFGTVLLALVGIKLPGLEFENQKVEAAYRKELVYGEDHNDRSQPLSIRELFGQVQKNYFRIYFTFTYFNVARYAYLQISSFIPLIAMAPSILAGALTLGLYSQINNAFNQVEESFKFLANSWTTIIDLMAIYKRLRLFESHIPVGAPIAHDFDHEVFLNSGTDAAE